MRSVNALLTVVGSLSGNPRAEVTSTAGIPDDTIIEALNDAQTRLQTIILRDTPHCRIWDKKSTQALVAAQDEYSLPSDAFYKSFIRRLEFSDTTLAADYYDIPMDNPRKFSGQTWNWPKAYCIEGEKLSLSPIPSSAGGSLRTTYVRALDKLDKKRGTVKSVTTVGGLGVSYATIVLENDSTLDATALAANDYVCVCDNHGVVKHYAVGVVSYTSGTQTLNLDSGVLVADGAIAAGNFITTGKYSTTHSALADECERYLIQYAVWSLQRLDSSSDSPETNTLLAAIETDILTAFSNLSLDLPEIWIMEEEWLE